MKTRMLLVALVCRVVSANGQETLKLMSHNALKYPGDQVLTRRMVFVR